MNRLRLFLAALRRLPGKAWGLVLLGTWGLYLLVRLRQARAARDRAETLERKARRLVVEAQRLELASAVAHTREKLATARRLAHVAELRVQEIEAARAALWDRVRPLTPDDLDRRAGGLGVAVALVALMLASPGYSVDRVTWTAPPSPAEWGAVAGPGGFVVALSAHRWSEVLTRLEDAQAGAVELGAVRAQVEAERRLVAALERQVVSLEAQVAGLDEMRLRLLADLETAERIVIRAPRRQRRQLAVGIAIGVAGAWMADRAFSP